MNTADIGEQAISKAAEVGLASQLDDVENLDVKIETDPLDLMQGNLDSVSIKGKGLVMKKELRAEKVRIETNSITLNPLKAALGEIELEHPTEARTLIVLKEEDLQTAFNSDYIQNKLQNLPINFEGEEVTAKIEQVQFKLPEIGKISFSAQVTIEEKDLSEKISFSAIPEVNAAGNNVDLKSIEYSQGENCGTEFAAALINTAKELLDLRNFELEEMSLKVRKLNVKPGKMTIEADTVIKNFPNV